MNKFTVRVNDPKGFARAFRLAAAMAAPESRWGDSIATQVLLRVSGFKAWLKATDLCQYLSIDLGLANCGQLTLDGDGELFLPSDWKVPSHPFTLVSEPSDTGTKVTLRHGVVEAEVSQDHATANWPMFPLANCGLKFSLPAAQLVHEFNRLAPICAQEKGRYALNGMLFEFDGVRPDDAGPFTPSLPPFQVRLVATDGRHLGMSTLPVTLKQSPPRFQPLLEHSHAENLARIAKTLASDDDPNVEVGFSPEKETVNDKGETTEVESTEPYMFFGSSRWSYTCRMVEGQFPDWKSVVPKLDATVLLHREAFIEALQAVKHACDEENTAAKFTFNADHLLIEAKSRTNGYAKTQMALSEVPPQMIIGLDPEYLLQACSALLGEWIVFKFRSADYGVELHDGAPDLRYHLVMPIDLITRPAEPKEPVLDTKETVWDGKAGKYLPVSEEAKAAARNEFEVLSKQHELDLETYKLELAQWRLAHRITGWSEAESTEREQEPGEFTPREGYPQIGARLADHPSLEELAKTARAAEISAKPKKTPKAGKPAGSEVQTQTATAVSPVRAKLEYSHEFGGTDEAELANSQADQASPQSMGLTLNKNQWNFSW